ncbi:MAG: 23S rRNA (adenine(2503)-C(2))-methyltransferase RlmN [Chlamydiia bacterium]|nr:23S rRNA (adenine(2503)-C(2))-methyltransferase RlmN [Chlamydiia bacterium]MCB1115064.1 23S rRNA (adenine(2503)-C(2))-methyltransferase RlmN [Chlamydiia bacterium]
MRELCGLYAKEVKSFFEAEGEKGFRAKQLFDWVYQKGVTDYDKMHNLPSPLRAALKEKMGLGLLKQEKIEQAKDQETIKFLWKLSDNRFVESVLIMSGERRTVCVSSQVGCPARCAFCASGKEGLLRNLTSAEIVEQVVFINAFLLERGEKVSHLVFMGMGEPLENYEGVVRAIKILIDPELFHFSTRRITVSTVGMPPNMKRLMEEDLRVNLALSLHAPNQHIRKKIVPYARKYPLEEVLQAARSYAKFTKRDMTYEYVMLAGINDQKESAEELAELLKGEQCTVNLIPFNPIPGTHLQRPEVGTIEAFRNILTKRGVRSTWRYTKGKDIAAACGQLALKK